MFARKGVGIVNTDNNAKEKWERKIEKQREHIKMKQDIEQLKIDMDKLKCSLMELTVTMAAGKCDGYA